MTDKRHQFKHARHAGTHTSVFGKPDQTNYAKQRNILIIIMAACQSVAMHIHIEKIAVSWE